MCVLLCTIVSALVTMCVCVRACVRKVANELIRSGRAKWRLEINLFTSQYTPIGFQLEATSRLVPAKQKICHSFAHLVNTLVS